MEAVKDLNTKKSHDKQAKNINIDNSRKKSNVWPKKHMCS